MGLIACTTLLAVGPLQAQVSNIYFRCDVQGANLNNGDGNPGDWADWGYVVSYLEAAQRDMAQDGSSAGPYQHAGVTIVKKLSKSSPAYMNALYQNTNLDDCEIRFVYHLTGGSEATFYTVELSNAKVSLVSIQGSAGTESGSVLEEITFHAGSIKRTHNPSGSISQQNLAVFPP
jgi:type VI secretion system Hcp family effector